MRTQDMAPEQIEEAKKLATPEQMLAYARDNGIDLTDDEVDGIAGGYVRIDGRACPYCGSREIYTAPAGTCKCEECEAQFPRDQAKWVSK